MWQGFIPTVTLKNSHEMQRVLASFGLINPCYNPGLVYWNLRLDRLDNKIFRNVLKSYEKTRSFARWKCSVSIHLHTVIVWSYTHKMTSSQRGKFNGLVNLSQLANPSSQSESSLQLDTGCDFSNIEDIRICQAFFDLHCPWHSPEYARVWWFRNILQTCP